MASSDYRVWLGSVLGLLCWCGRTENPALMSFLADTGTNMKPNATLTPFFSPEQMATALAAAPDCAVADVDNPPAKLSDWDDVIVSRSLPELREKLADRRTRGPNKRQIKEQIAIRFSPEVMAYFRTTGPGWQTRMDEALKDWIKSHSPT